MSIPSSPPAFIRRRYRLVEWLGRGSVGLVYRAQDDALDRPVALKFLDQAGGDAPERSVRFLREARNVAQLSHANIMSIYDMGQEQGWEYLVLEFIPGGDLRNFLRQRGGQLLALDAISIVSSVLQALDFAHDHGIIHRDIKPENIFLTQAGQVKVGDFGLARSMTDAHLTQDGSITGTIAYLAPECLRGMDCSLQSDLYSVGVVLYELLTGNVPYHGEHLAMMLSQILQGTITPPGDLVPGLFPALEDVVLRLLASDPAGRFLSASEALSELERVKIALSNARLPGVFSLIGERTSQVELVETERRQLAGQVEASIIAPLKLLLAQAAAFEQTMPGQPAARMAVSVLASLARQVLQQANDLESNLRPALLETLGLEPALEMLADRYARAANLQVTLEMTRLAHRPPPEVELALFRLTQDVLEILHSQNAGQVRLGLKIEEQKLLLDFSFPASIFIADEKRAGLQRWVDPIRGECTQGRSAQGEIHLGVRVPLRQEVHFTPREQQVLDALVQGWSNKEIAHRLSVSSRTVNYHLDHIFSKLGVRTRTEAALIALRQGFARRPSQSVSLPTLDKCTG